MFTDDKDLHHTADANAREVVAHDAYTRATQALMANESMDIDFRRMVLKYWETYLPEAGDPVAIALVPYRAATRLRH